MNEQAEKPLNPQRQLFEQQPGETNKAFAWFNAYLAMGGNRSIVGLSKKIQKSVGALQKISARFDWPARVQAYAAHMAAVARAAQEEEVRSNAPKWARCDQELREQEWETRRQALEVALEAIRRWHETKSVIPPTLQGIARMLDLASILGHRATGTSMERVELTGEAGGPIRVEFEAALRKVYGQVIDVDDAEPESKALPEGKEGE